jgi:hypothetical protein
MTNDYQFEKAFYDTQAQVKDFLVEYYGPKCEDFTDYCVVCRKWRYFEALFCDLDTIRDHVESSL